MAKRNETVSSSQVLDEFVGSPPESSLPVLGLDSSAPIPAGWLSSPNRFQGSERCRTDRPIRVDNGNLICACPECGAPMSVRLWLMVADCWQCGTSIALATYRRQLRTRPEPARPQSASRPPEAAPQARVNRPSAAAARRFATEAPREPARALPPSRSGPPVFVRQASSWAGRLRDVPAWLASLLVHLLLLIALGLLTLRPDIRPEQITLSTAVGSQDRMGGRVELPASEDEPSYDLPVPEDPEWDDPEQQAELQLADQEARQLRMDPESELPSLPSLRELRMTLEQEGPQRLFATRDPRIRVEWVRSEGGTTLTEAAVARGLRWLAEHQLPDGHWSLNRFAEHPGCNQRCSGAADLASDSAATSLALLPFLGAGQTHRTGIYRDQVARGLDWLIVHQRPDGDLRHDARGQPGMYAHGQGAIVLCEAYAMTGDARLRQAAERAIQFIVDAQHPAGGWRYQPGEPGDTSVLGWQLMALQSARAAGLSVPYPTLAAADDFLDGMMARDEVRYRYQRRREPTHVMTAEALLCRMYLGWTLREPRLQEGLRWLVEDYPPELARPDIYYWYYATQVLHHGGGPLWSEWNFQLRDVLVQSQVRRGHAAGSWDPRGPHSQTGGRIYMTALAICTLEVYYRHAPIFRRPSGLE